MHSAKSKFFDQLNQVEGYLPENGNLATTIATAGNVTYEIGNLLSAIILRDPAGDNRTDTTPTAAQIIAALKNPQKGDNFTFTIRNTADGNETITVSGGTGVTISGTATIGQNNSKSFKVVVTASTTVTMYSLGTAVH